MNGLNVTAVTEFNCQLSTERDMNRLWYYWNL